MRNWCAILFALCAVACLDSARADVTISLSPSVQNSARGLELVFSGTLTNTSAGKVFLNDIVPTLSGASATNLAFQPNAFFSNVPGVLLPGESYSNDELFRVLLTGAAPPGDYGGTVTVRGGADIFADADLASGPFSVLSPAVSVAATDASASEFGPDPGVIVISRTGSTAIDLPVAIAISGTAVNGIAFGLVPASLNIPAGSRTATVMIAPLPNNLAEGDRTAILSLNLTAAYNAGLSISDGVIIHDKPADAWRFENFGASANDPAAADGGDWEGDGIHNLLEFALALDPKESDPQALPAALVADDYLTFSFVPNSAAADVQYVVEASTSLVSWNADDVEEVSLLDPDPPGVRTFRYRFPVSETSEAFLRLRVSRTNL